MYIHVEMQIFQNWKASFDAATHIISTFICPVPCTKYVWTELNWGPFLDKYYTLDKIICAVIIYHLNAYLCFHLIFMLKYCINQSIAIHFCRKVDHRHHHQSYVIQKVAIHALFIALVLGKTLLFVLQDNRELSAKRTMSL